MYEAYRIIFWGIFFATFHLNLGPIEILPFFIGWIIVGNGVKKLNAHHSSDAFLKAKTYVFVLILLSLIAKIDSIFLSYYDQSPILSIIWSIAFGMVELFAQYKILEGAVEYFTSQEKQEIAEEYISRIKDYSIGFIVFLLLQCVAMTFVMDGLIIIVALLAIFLRIWFMAMMSFLKKLCDDQINPDEDNIITE